MQLYINSSKFDIIPLPQNIQHNNKMTDAPWLASTGPALILVGTLIHAPDNDLRPHALLRWWHSFFMFLDEHKPVEPEAYLAGRDTSSFEYVLHLDEDAQDAESAAEAAVEAMTRFAIDVLRYSDKVRVVPFRQGCAS